MDLKLKDAVVLVTGGSRGIGLAIAKGFVHEGARVAICGRDPVRLAAAAAEIGGGANIIHPSLTRTDRHVGRMERRAASSNISIEAAEAEVGATFPIGRVPAPEDIVPLVLLLSSPLAGAITGQALAVDGGIGLSVQY